VKILIIRFSAIGDILLTFHVVHEIQASHPNAEIHFLTKPEHSKLFDFLNVPVQVHTLKSNLWETSSFLKAQKFDTVIDLHNNLRTRMIQGFMLRKEWHRFPKLNFNKWLLTQFKWDTLPRKHVVDRYFQACKHLSFTQHSQETLHINPKVNLLDFLPESSPYVVWVLGAKFKTKQFPEDKILEVLRRLTLKVVFIGGKEEAEMGESLARNYSEGINLAGKLSLNESAQMVKSAKLVVTNDTGLMHFAAFFNKPILCIWGNTTPLFGMYPYHCSDVTHFEVPELTCRPCSKIGHAQCPKSHFNCMMKQDTQKISEAIISKFHS